MSVRFCTGCGKEKDSAAKFCGECGKLFTGGELEAAAAATESFSVASESIIRKRSTIPNIIVNILITILLFMSQAVIERQLEWGGGESYFFTLIIIISGLQVLGFFLHKRRYSFSALLPIIVSGLFSIASLLMYKSYTEWLEYQGYQTQNMVGGDTSIILFCLFFYITIIVLNIILLFRRNQG
ncbi:hypothetical protein [Fictibacillus sp. JL2B1089]|uniref:hypothetical protein n=1 Tax=Fictibacillus sp. JL2B1089 TaxID=3399565 RepID=UPI003A8B30F3